jgi:uncharacterized damage-inducible protein DinB
MMTLSDVIRELEQDGPATRRVLERLPPDKLEWRPHPKSMTLGQLAMHVANIPGAIAELAQQPSFDTRTPIPRPGAGSPDEVLATFDESMARARRVLAGMKDADMGLPWRMMNGERELWSIPRAAFLRAVMLNHWYHHRGQLTVYLRQTGASVPAVYGDSADERAIPV